MPVHAGNLPVVDAVMEYILDVGSILIGSLADLDQPVQVVWSRLLYATTGCDCTVDITMTCIFQLLTW